MLSLRSLCLTMPFVMGGLLVPHVAWAAPIYDLKMVARPADQYPTEGQKGKVIWTITNISNDLSNPTALLPIQLLTVPPGAAKAVPEYTGKVDANNEVYNLKIVDPAALDGKTLNKNEFVEFTEEFQTRDKRSPAPFLNTVGIWNLTTTMNWKPVATGTNKTSTSKALVYVTDPRIATDISGGTTFSTPTAPSSGTGTKAIDYITYGWSFFLSQCSVLRLIPRRVAALVWTPWQLRRTWAITSRSTCETMCSWRFVAPSPADCSPNETSSWQRVWASRAPPRRSRMGDPLTS